MEAILSMQGTAHRPEDAEPQVAEEFVDQPGKAPQQKWKAINSQEVDEGNKRGETEGEPAFTIFRYLKPSAFGPKH